VVSVQIAVERIQHLAMLRGESIHQVLKSSGLNKSVLDNMKRGSMPSADKLATLADYFDCSVDYLLGRVDDPRLRVQDFPDDHVRVAMEKDAPDLSAEEIMQLRELLKKQVHR